MTRKLFAVLLLASLPVVADEISYKSLQSGFLSSATPLYDHGLHGERQIIAVLDTGLDIDSCFFAEADGSKPPINTVDLRRRKVIAYDFLYDNPASSGAYDNQGHGTHAAAAAAGDQMTPAQHDFGDGIATAAKLVIQDAGYTGGDACSQRPGIGCPVNITPILDQAYNQGARIHSNSWGDRQGATGLVVPTANYSASARDIDAFVYAHPDMLVVFNTGNLGSAGTPPASSLSAPGCAKNTLQVGGTRNNAADMDDTLSGFSLAGPTRDGRIKPDVVGPAFVTAGDARVVTGSSCATTAQPGTSWSSPSIAGAAALVRQYFTDGYYPSGAANASNAITPSAALLKATIIAAASRVPWRANGTPSAPVPSFEQGFGFPVLDNALYFPGDRAKLRVNDVANDSGLAIGETTTLRLDVKAGTQLKAVLVWTDPAGVARTTGDPTPELVNDLDLRVVDPSGLTLGGTDHLNNVEAITIAAPSAGIYSITISANRLGSGARQGYALVVTGDISEVQSPRAVRSRAVRH